MKGKYATSLSARAGLVLWMSYAVLLLQQIADAWVRQAPWIIWLIKLLPLLLFLPGMARDRLRSYIWLCFVCLGYFTSLVESLFARPGDVLSITGIIAVVTLFVAAMFYVRWRSRELRAGNSPQTGSGD